MECKKKMSKGMYKNAQHEIIGFVLIIVVVAVVGLIFLSLSIGRGGVSERTSVEVSDFIQSSMYYTTECAIVFEPQYENLQDLIRECVKNSGKKCLDGRSVCETLNNTIKEIVSSSFDVNGEGVNKAFEFKINYKDKSTDEFMKFNKGLFGNCSYILGGKQSIPLDSGNINVELELCKR
jgi:hypothetical protein